MFVILLKAKIFILKHNLTLLKICISLIAVFFIYFHFYIRTVDPVGLILIVIIILPWINSIFKSIEINMPGGGLKAEFIECFKDKLIVPSKPSVDEQAEVELIKHTKISDLLRLRKEMEQRIMDIAEEKHIYKERGVIGILDLIVKRNYSNKPLVDSTKYILELANKAEHGEEIDPSLLTTILQNKSKILASLSDV